MKNRVFTSIAYSLIFILTLLLVACDKEPIENSTKFEILTEYLKENNLDLPDIQQNWLTTACTVNTTGVENYYIIDLRESEDFAKGHIQGAVNSSLDNILDVALGANSKPILIVCSTGQKSAYAFVALRLSGYYNSAVLMYGMSSWNAEFDLWSGNISNLASGNDNWIQNDSFADNNEFDYPNIIANSENGKDILNERVVYILNEGFESVDASNVLENSSDYFINCYLTESEISIYGHINGAYRIKENLSLSSNGFKQIDPDSDILLYCWTGQTSALVSAYLKVLGYHSASLDFGLNSLIFDELETHKWIESENLPYVNE